MDWASAVDGIEHAYDVQKATLAVLFRMINSPHRRPHIIPEKWRLLEYFASVPDDSQPLRCVDNRSWWTRSGTWKTRPLWFFGWRFSWLKYKQPIPQVREQMETVTSKVAQRTDPDMYLSVVDSELRKAEDALTQYNTWSTDPAAIALRTKIDILQQARVTLVALKRG